MLARRRPIPRQEILKRLRENIKNGKPIVGAGAGIGLSAKFEEAGGADLIVIYDSGRYRMHGRPSTCGHQPLGDANTVVMQMAREVLPVVKHTPVLAGVFAHDPFVFMDEFLEKVKAAGFSGIQNFPTLASYDGKVRAELEEVGFGYYNEVEMVKMAREMDLLTTPYVYNVSECERMVDAGADIIVVHCGCTMGGSTGVSDKVSVALDYACEFVQEIRDRAVELNPEIMVIAHGGPLARPSDFDYLMKHTNGVHGFYGASSIERIPVEIAIENCVKEFKTVRMKPETL